MKRRLGELLTELHRLIADGDEEAFYGALSAPAKADELADSEARRLARFERSWWPNEAQIEALRVIDLVVALARGSHKGRLDELRELADRLLFTLPPSERGAFSGPIKSSELVELVRAELDRVGVTNTDALAKLLASVGRHLDRLQIRPNVPTSRKQSRPQAVERLATMLSKRPKGHPMRVADVFVCAGIDRAKAYSMVHNALLRRAKRPKRRRQSRR